MPSLIQTIDGNPTVASLQEIASIIGVTLAELVSEADCSDFIALINKVVSCIPHRPSLRLGSCWTSWKVLSNVGCSPQSSIIKSLDHEEEIDYCHHRSIRLLGGGIGGYVYHSNQVKDEKWLITRRRCLIIASIAID